MTLIRNAEETFRGALARVSVPARLRANVHCEGERLRIDDQEYPLASYRRFGLIAIGKAAVSMSDAFLAILSASADAISRLRGIVVAGVMPIQPHVALQYFVGGHPLPTRESLGAANAIRSLLSEFGPDDLVIFLISGGASAMVERGLHPNFSFEDTVELYRALLSSGLRIDQMNCVRKHLSAVKGGRLAVASNGATQISLLISDVPGDDLSVIGSGPSVPDRSTVEDCSRVLQDLLRSAEFSPKLREALGSSRLQETPKPGDSAFARSSYQCILSASHLLQAAAELAARSGFFVEVDNTCDDWECDAAATYLLDRLRSLRALHGRVCLLSGGEVSVSLPKDVGIGGRNQHFALACALQLRHRGERATVLSAGTDGLDGNSPAAGAVIDEKTCDLARAGGIDPQGFYDRFDSYSFFQAVGGAIVTGPTENNLRDLRILLSEP